MNSETDALKAVGVGDPSIPLSSLTSFPDFGLSSPDASPSFPSFSSPVPLFSADFSASSSGLFSGSAAFSSVGFVGLSAAVGSPFFSPG